MAALLQLQNEMKTFFPRRATGLLSCLLGCVLALSAEAKSWWSDEWSIRKKITVDTTSDGVSITDPVGTATVLVRIHGGVYQFGAGKEDGSDLRFVADDDKTLLPFHIEKYDGLMNEAFAWVKVKELKPGEKKSFWLYYGNAGPKAVKVDDLKGTYDADTALVYHFNERGAPAVDSSGNGNTAEKAGVAVEGAIIGSGLRLEGKAPISVPASPSLNWSENGGMTWSAWVKIGTLEANAVAFSRRDGTKAFVIGADNGVPFVEVDNGSGSQKTAAGAPIAPASWHHWAVVADGPKTTLYVDGEVYGTVGAGVPALNTPLFIGGNDPASGDAGTGLSGELDELIISKVARPVGYVKFAAAVQGGEKSQKLITLGTDEQTSSWLSEGYFGVILKNLTADGWAVIVILMIMAAISWFVMISKASYLRRIGKANNKFLREWEHVAADLTVLDHGDADSVRSLGGRVDSKTQRVLRDASVYRIYHIGVEEIRRRLLAHEGEGNKVLSSNSFPAIKASLDGGLVREMQKLNSMMVLLTIAISGGPFLGLLGTVVGVMITFAAIAAAGDVNVNSIAPGIAAALLATVAGLAVAIPALFGYNYLLAQVKNATSDMHVFIDEFITKMAEFYGRAD